MMHTWPEGKGAQVDIYRTALHLQVGLRSRNLCPFPCLLCSCLFRKASASWTSAVVPVPLSARRSKTSVSRAYLSRSTLNASTYWMTASLSSCLLFASRASLPWNTDTRPVESSPFSSCGPGPSGHSSRGASGSCQPHSSRGEQITRESGTLVQNSATSPRSFEGGRVTSLEHPRNSIAWRLPESSHLLRAISADVIVIPVCAHGSNFRKKSGPGHLLHRQLQVTRHS